MGSTFRPSQAEQKDKWYSTRLGSNLLGLNLLSYSHTICNYGLAKRVSSDTPVAEPLEHESIVFLPHLPKANQILATVDSGNGFFVP